MIKVTRYRTHDVLYFQGKPFLRTERGGGEEMSREQVLPGLRLQLLVRVVRLLHDLRDGTEDEIEASQVK